MVESLVLSIYIMGVYQILIDFLDKSYCLEFLFIWIYVSMLLQCNNLSLQHFVHATFCPCNVLSMRRIFCDVLSATFCPRHYVRGHLSCNELSCDILSMRYFVRNDLSATICPRRFVLRHSVLAPPSLVYTRR
jgi:hypothetical protein